MYDYYQTIYKLLSECVNKENQCGKWVFARRSLWLAVGLGDYVISLVHDHYLDPVRAFLPIIINNNAID